jgi:hypothetical protein
MLRNLTLACVVLLAACSNTKFTPGDGGTTPETCTSVSEGKTSCSGTTWRKCQDGSYVTIGQCTAMCLDQLGCVDCDPTLGKTCVGNDVHECTTAGKAGNLVQACGTLRCSNGVCGNTSTCSAGTGLIYVVDDANKFLSFNPEQNNALTEIGTLSCPAGTSWPDWASPTATPFSMSVDRTGKAWVLFTSGEIFSVDIKTAACSKTSFAKGQSGYELFGMGFVSDAKGSSQEKLYIHGGKTTALEKGNLGTIDPATLKITTVGPLKFTSGENSPELTGTGNGDLYAFFPNGSTSFVRQIDKATGNYLQEWKVKAPDGDVKAWAFAHWFGKLYIFLTVTNLIGIDNSVIMKLDLDMPTNVQTIKQNLPYAIVGAGVSTCATVLQ